MINKKIISIIAVFFIVLVILSIILRSKKEKEEKIEEISLLAKEAENSIRSKGILQLDMPAYLKFENVTVEVYYKEDYCLNTIKEAIKKFDNVKIEKAIRVNKKDAMPDNIKIPKENIEFPFIILKGHDKKEERIIKGIAACSEEILTYSICDSIKNQPESCSRYMFNKIESYSGILGPAEDKECYENCFVEYIQDNKIISGLWYGPPCKKIEGYVEGATEVKNKECLGKSCKSNYHDKACCNQDDCVYQNKCYNAGALHDIDEDGRKEICIIYENNSFWSDPDKDKLSCSFANYSWFDCKLKTECANGVNSYSDKKNGLCCGDDENELFVKCNGEICYKEDFACCKPNQCVYENKCYPAGCADIKKESGVKKVYCDGARNEWIDLDEEYCEQCLGKDSWPGSFCCGDDENEGRYYKEITFHEGEGEKATGRFLCTDKKSQCVSLTNNKIVNEGCFNIPRIEKDVFGKYYCKKGEWYDPDYSEEYCEECGFDWIYDMQKNRCCGDDDEEYFVEMDNLTVACYLNSSYASKTESSYYQLCGNDILEEKEECEPTGGINNRYCSQTTADICVDGKLGRRDKFGDCNNACECDYDKFNYACTKGECGAECEKDDDCDKGMVCNISDCRCYEKEESQNFIKNCPSRIDLKINKKKFYVNDTLILEVNVYDNDNKSMPNVYFWRDVIVDNEPVGTSIYLTNQYGMHVINKLITEKSSPGLFEYIIKTFHKDCAAIGESVKAEVIVDKLASKEGGAAKEGVKRLAEKTKKEIVEEWNITETDFEEPFCGNNKIEVGETCEGNSICRNSLGCDYRERKYDVIDYCNNCNCQDDAWSKPDSDEYCQNCGHCGDGVLNCGELCDNETIYIGNVCRNGRLYNQFGVCTDCSSYKNVSSKILLDNCFCDCPDNTQENCFNGDYIHYHEDYFAGCSNNKCNECECKDDYTKDSNNDGTEDKCSHEFCGNRIDDNDNRIIDEEECIWHHCSQCGQGITNLCDKKECSNPKERCFFEEAVLGYGFCSECSLLSSCEDYGYQKNNCIEDPCNLSLCFWNNFTCCTDTDKDEICDYSDNCPHIFNPLQEDEDKDGRGSKCEICDKEQSLFYPQEQNETICNDKIDNDCDYLIDCEDKDCSILCINISNISKGVFNESK